MAWPLARLRALILGIGLFVAIQTAVAQDRGQFEVLTATDELVDGIYEVDALIYLRLPTEATDALHATVPLTIRIEVQFLNRLWFWWDNTEFEKVQRFRLSYYPLADRYVVHNLQTNQRSPFASLEDALEFIGQVDALPVVDAALLDDDRRYDIRVRAVLDKEELPGPLRMMAFWRRDWSIASEWLLWRLDDA
jgi:hypothetical protein